VDNHPWCPEGATWLYRGDAASGSAYYKLSYQKDTLWAGRPVKKIVVTAFTYLGLPVPPAFIRTSSRFFANFYMYNSNDSIFWWHNNTFQLLYLFNPNLASSWTLYPNSHFRCGPNTSTNSNVVSIQSIQNHLVQTRQFVAINLRPQDYWSIGVRILRNIGSLESPIPVPGRLACNVIDSGASNPQYLLCYEDSLRGMLEFTNATHCPSLMTRLNEVQLAQIQLQVMPNPASSTLKILNYNNLNIEKIIITDLMGRVMQMIEQPSASEIPISDLADGIYIIQLKTQHEGTHISKFVKSN
jgi:hypothetical protein